MMLSTCIGNSIFFRVGESEFACLLLPTRTSEQGNVIGLVRIYNIAMCTKNIVLERTRDLIYLFVATDFFPKMISPSAGENSGELTNPLPESLVIHHFCHTH